MATVPSFRTWVVGELVTASFMNTNIRDAGNFLTAVPIFAGHATVAQSIPTNTGTSLLIDTEDTDPDSGHSTVTNTARYTAQTAGWWRFGGGGSLAANATGARLCWVDKNGAGQLNGSATSFAPTAANPPEMTVKTGFVNLLVNDFVQIQLFQSSGGALLTVIAGVEAQPSFNMQWVRV